MIAWAPYPRPIDFVRLRLTARGCRRLRARLEAALASPCPIGLRPPAAHCARLRRLRARLQAAPASPARCSAAGGGGTAGGPPPPPTSPPLHPRPAAGGARR